MLVIVQEQQLEYLQQMLIQTSQSLRMLQQIMQLQKAAQLTVLQISIIPMWSSLWKSRPTVSRLILWKLLYLHQIKLATVSTQSYRFQSYFYLQSLISFSVLRGPSPEFLQSIMQMAGQIMSRTGQNITTTSGATPTVPPPDGSSQSTQANVSSTQSTGQNSQARGNTQTNPTTATQTRSTARPHVHLAQHAMQGFDPFLPCNSHHVRRRISTRNIPQQQGNPNNNSRPQQNAAANVANQFNPIYNIVNGILSSFQNVYNRQRGNQQHPQTSTPPNVSVPDSAAAGAGGEYVIPPPPLSQLPFFLPHIQNMVTILYLIIFI